MSNLFTVAHVAKLHEIQSARLRRGQKGVGPDVEDLIRRLEGGGVRSNDVDERTRQTEVLWKKGFGRELGFKKFKDYLATIPEVIPHNDHPELFNRLVLVERRVGIVTSSKMLGLTYHHDVYGTPKNFYDRTYPNIEFIWCQDGRKNRNKSIRACRDSFEKGIEIGLTAIEGLCLYAQDHTVTSKPNDHVLDFPGSVVDADPEGAACLDRDCDGGVRLSWDHDDDFDPDYGSASRRA